MEVVPYLINQFSKKFFIYKIVNNFYHTKKVVFFQSTYTKNLYCPNYRYLHSMSGDMLCGGWYTTDSCLQYKSGSWTQFSWKLQHPRSYHTSWRSKSGKVFLIGGSKDLHTEKVTPNGSSLGFKLTEKNK